MNRSDSRKSRPYLPLKADELDTLAEENWDNKTVLSEILAELQHRKTHRAREVQLSVALRIITLFIDSFRWPSTSAPIGDGELTDDIEWFSKGPLTVLGYHVGLNGSDETVRQQILDSVYKKSLPFTNSSEYMSLWGQPKTSHRLRKLAESIAAFVRNAKRQSRSSYSLAITHWEADMKYLKRTYYDGRYDFNWPKTTVR